MTSRQVADKIRVLLETGLNARSVEVIDESDKHRHHKKPEDAEKGNFKVTVVSAAFKDKNLIERHRMIYRALDGLKDDIHALSITATAPGE